MLRPLLRRTAGIGTAVLLAAGLLAAVPLVADPPAAEAAGGWQKFDRRCHRNAHGKACSVVQVRRVNGERRFRARFAIAPAKGRWIRPTQYAIFAPLQGSEEKFCPSRDRCPRIRSTWRSGWKRWSGHPQVFKASYRARNGTRHLYAGWSRWAPLKGRCVRDQHGKVCIQSYMRTIRSHSRMKARMALAPAKGRAITPRWVQIQLVRDGRIVRKNARKFCSPRCTPRRKIWRSDVHLLNPGFFSRVVTRAAYTNSTGTHRIRATF